MFADDVIQSPSPTLQWIAAVAPLILAATGVVWMLRDWLKERTRIMAAQAQAIEDENERKKDQSAREEVARLLKVGTSDTRIYLSEIKQQGAVAIDQNKEIIGQGKEVIKNTNGINEGLSNQIKDLHEEVRQANEDSKK